MKKYLLLVLLMTLALAGNNAVDFLQTGLSARSMALGNTGTASGGHIDTAFLNPAALQNVRHEFFSAAVRDFEMAENKMFAWAGRYELWNRPLVLGVIYAASEIKGLDRVILDTDERPVQTGRFNAEKNNYTLVLAQEQSNGNWHGLSLRQYAYVLDRARADATALDIGGLWHLWDIWGAGIFGGVSLRNVGRAKVVWSTGHADTIPFGMNYGLSIQRNVFTNPFLFNLDWNWREEEELRFGCGLEYTLSPLTLRVGWNERLAYGLGLHYFGLTLDYAQTTHKDLGLQQRVSVLLWL